MAETRLKPDLVVATVVAAISLAVAVAAFSPAIVDALLRAGQTNIYYRPYLTTMGALAVANAALALALVPICRKMSGRWVNIPVWAAILLSTFIVSEISALAIARGLYNQHHVGSRSTRGLEYSPSLGIVPKPSFRIPLMDGDITHTADGHRGPEPPPRSPDHRKTFLAIGGSSTYDIGLPDDQTWPTNLARMFPDQVRMLNLGIPGHSTAEHLTLAATVAWKYQPDVVLYYIGWNDVRSSHLDESTDYARFHKRRLFHNFSVTEPTSFFALGYLAKRALAMLDETSLYNISQVEMEPGVEESLDEDLLEIYLNNVRMLAAVTRQMGAIPVFVPQVADNYRLTGDQPFRWIPRMPQGALPQVLARFNNAMMETARSAGALVIPEVLEIDWQESDFVDRVHFAQHGAERFACALGTALIDHGVLAPSRSSSPTMPPSTSGGPIHHFDDPAISGLRPWPELQLCMGPQ